MERAYKPQGIAAVVSECVLWTRGQSMGYGITYDGKKSIRAHRLAWITEHGAIPSGLHVHHVCGQKLCVNVAHLRLVTLVEHAEIHRRPPPTACPQGHPYPESLRSNGKGCALCRRRPPRPPRTHCLHGHEYTPENTSIRPDGSRRCLACHRENAARYKAADPERIREINRRATKRYFAKKRAKTRQA